MTNQEKVQRLLDRADAGDAQAQYDLAMHYYMDREGRPENEVQAAIWMKKAVEQGLPEAEWRLSQWYASGTNVQNEPETARKLMLKAATAGLIDAVYGMYLATRADPVEGPIWFEKAKVGLTRAAEEDDPDGKHLLGQFLFQPDAATLEPSEMARLLTYPADFGFPEAQFKLGLMLIQGQGVPVDQAKGLDYIRTAASLRVFRAEMLVEALDEVPLDGSPTFGAYLDALKAAAEGGNPKAQTALGLIYLFGLGLERSAGQARRLLREAAEQGNTRAQFALGRTYPSEPPFDIGKAESKRWLTLAAEYGHARAAYDLAQKHHMYLPDQNLKVALRWYQHAANLGLSDAQVALAVMSEEGNGVEKDDEQAFNWYLKAAEQGHAYGQLRVARLYERGQGTAQDYEQAMHWYRLAAGTEDEDWRNEDIYGPAVVGIGRLFEGGLGVRQNHETAVEWYRKGTEVGNDEAYLHLGRMYEAGRGVPLDLEEAIRCYVRAAREELYWHDYGDEFTDEAIIRLGRLDADGHPIAGADVDWLRTLYGFHSQTSATELPPPQGPAEL